MKNGLAQSVSKNSIIGLLLLIILCFGGFFLYKSNQKSNDEIVSNKAEFSKPEADKEIILEEFNPNELSKDGWIALGFTEHEASTILNWKDVLGDNFSNKSQLKKCYAISKEKFEQLNPYILLPEKKENNFQQEHFQNSFTPKNQIKIAGKFNPDNYSANDWQKMGFSERQAESIVKYKNYLGGSFISKEKFKECFIISSENYQKLAPYLILPDSAPANSVNTYASKSENSTKIQQKYAPFDPNTLDFDGWKNLGFSDKQANVIINYRVKNLRGSFKNLEDIKKCFVISEAKFEEIKPFIVLNEQVIDANSPTSVSSKTEKSITNFANIDLNEISADQLMDFGFDKRAANSFIGFRKSLGGFVNKNQIYETYAIDRELAEKLEKTGTLDTKNVQKYTLVNAPESWLKTHPYFKYSADKIIFYRISEPDDKKIWKFLKTKPEYEAKMRMYLK